MKKNLPIIPMKRVTCQGVNCQKEWFVLARLGGPFFCSETCQQSRLLEQRTGEEVI